MNELEQRVENLLEQIADIQRVCRDYGAQIYFVRDRFGRLMAYTKSAVRHSANCKAMVAASR